MPLSESEIQTRLPEIDGWRYDGRQLTRLLQFPTFAAAVHFVDRLTIAADKAAHHPDIDIRYDTVRLSLSTHSDNGITDKDFSLAKEIDRLVRE